MSKRRLTKQERDIVRAWERGRPADDVTVGKHATVVLSLRIDNELLDRLTERSLDEGKPASALARELIERGLMKDGPRTPKELARMFARWAEEAGVTKPRKR